MIIDTSALVAAVQDEDGAWAIKRAMLSGGIVPAPVVVEYHRVTTRRGSRPAPEAATFLQDLLGKELRVEPFTGEDAELAAAANLMYGAGNRRGGRLNLVDLMVYAVAKRRRAPILCTGGDFAATDAEIHPASRTG